jgi:hypothetical protein
MNGQRNPSEHPVRWHVSARARDTSYIANRSAAFREYQAEQCGTLRHVMRGAVADENKKSPGTGRDGFNCIVRLENRVSRGVKCVERHDIEVFRLVAALAP